MLEKHYSPKAKLLVLNWRDDADLQSQLVNRQLVNSSPATSSRTPKFPPAKILRDVSVIPHDAEAFARAIYAELHRCDEAGAEWIVVEAPPDSPEWSGIADRLRRAAA